MKEKKIVLIVSIILTSILVITGSILCYFNYEEIRKEKNTITSVLTIDVNPSLEINLNKDNEVVSVIALNDDSKELLKDKSFKGDTIDEAINTLVDLLKEKNYLSEETNTILINVKSDNENLSSIVKESVDKVTTKKEINTEVVVLEVEETDELKKLAKEYNITLSKAYYISEQIKDQEGLNIEEFVNTSVSEIKTKVEDYVEEQERIKQEEENKKKQEEEAAKRNEQQNNNYSGARSGSLAICENVTYNFSDNQAKEAAISAVGADDNARFGAQTTVHNYNGQCAWETIFYYNKTRYYFYYSVTTGEFLEKRSETYVAIDFDEVTRLTKEYFVSHYGVSYDSVAVTSSGSSGYDDPNNEVTVNVNGTYYTVIMSKRTGEVISCTEGSKYYQ